MELHEYKDRYSTAEVSRDGAGVLTIRMHWRGKSLMWGGPPHEELPELFNAIASDRENRVVILTGTGDTFIVLGDSMQIVWPLLLGPNRGRYFLLTGQKIQAEEARQLGVVGEVLPGDQVL